MPPRSTIDLLPAPVREELDRRLIRTAYGDYKGHHAWLHAQGHQVSLDALKRYGLRTRKTLSAQEAQSREKAAIERARVKATTEAAVELMAIAGDDIAAYYKAETLRTKMLLQDAMYQDGLTVKEMETLSRAMKDNAQTLKLLSDLTPQTAGKNDKDRAREAEKRGVSPEVIQAIRERIMYGTVAPTDAPDADKENG